MEEIFKKKLEEKGLSFENLSEESKLVFDLMLSNLKDNLSQVPGIVFPVSANSDETWVKNAVTTVLFCLMLRGKFKKLPRSVEISVLTLYIMSGLGEKTKQARENVRMVLQMEEKPLNSLNRDLREKGLLIPNGVKPSDYTFCKELEIIHQYYKMSKSKGVKEMSFGVKLKNG